MLRPLALALAALPALAWAGTGPPSPVQCDEEYADCKETCTMEYGTSTRQAARAKLKTCMGRCVFREKDCREAVLEASRSDVAPEAFDRQSGSGGGADDNRPYRATSQEERDAAQRKADEERRLEDERRAEEAQRRAESQKAAEARRSGKGAAADKPRETGEKKGQGSEEPAPRAADPGAGRPEASAEPEPQREDPKAKKAAPPPAEKPAPEKKKGKKEPRPLDEWDPDAL